MTLTDKPFWITIQYICVVFLTVCFTGLLVSDGIFVWFIAIFFWLFILAFIVACISFICSLRCNSKHKKILLIFNVVNIILFSFLFFNPSGRCDADIMESHYAEYGGRMEHIYRYLYDKMTPGCSVEIEFEHGDVSIFHFSNGNGVMESNWDPSEEKIDSLLIQSGLDRNSLAWLEKELNEIGCISISLQAVPDAPFCIGFRRVGMGKYDYHIYQRPLSSDEQKEINESDAAIVHSPLVVFEYGGGAIGSQNFIGKDEYLKKKAQLQYETFPPLNLQEAYHDKKDNYPSVAESGFKPFQYDNGDDYVSDGRYRIVDKDGKIGYATEDNSVIISPRFAFGFPFKNGRAKVTDSGHLEEVEGSNGEYHYWESDNWYWIDKMGNRLGMENEADR